MTKYEKNELKNVNKLSAFKKAAYWDRSQF